MKHALIILVIGLVAHVAWRLAKPGDLVRLKRLIQRNALSAGTFIFVVLACLVAAFYQPSLNLL